MKKSTPSGRETPQDHGDLLRLVRLLGCVRATSERHAAACTELLAKLAPYVAAPGYLPPAAASGRGRKPLARTSRAAGSGAGPGTGATCPRAGAQDEGGR